jgi:hypothetical protein
MYFDFRSRERIKLFYSGDGMEQILKNVQALKPHYTLYDFILAESRPSFSRLIDNLRKPEQEKFWELDKSQYKINTIYPGLGFKTPYRDEKVGGYVYVLDMGSWADRSQRVIDKSRERAGIWIGNYKEGNISLTPQEWLRVKSYRANDRYVDRLTKKQREALTFIRMLPAGEFVVGLGGWMEGYSPSYVLDC